MSEHLGLCCICSGGLAGESIHVDQHGDKWDIHKGVCAILAGDVPVEHQTMHNFLIWRAKRYPDECRQEYYMWVFSIAEENHYDHDMAK